jgi:hypothetical protein
MGHRYGKADSMGWIHLQDKQKVTKRGMRQLLRLIATVKLNHLREKKPQWLRLYEVDTWAFHEGYETWHVRFPSEWSEVLAAAACGARHRCAGLPCPFPFMPLMNTTTHLSETQR